MRLRRGLPLLSSPAADMLNLVFDLMAGTLAASGPLPASTLEDVSLASLIWIKLGTHSPIPQYEVRRRFPCACGVHVRSCRRRRSTCRSSLNFDDGRRLLDRCWCLTRGGTQTGVSITQGDPTRRRKRRLYRIAHYPKAIRPWPSRPDQAFNALTGAAAAQADFRGAELMFHGRG